MPIQIDHKAPTPIFQQLVLEIERLLIIGELQAAEFIPSIRDLAVSLGINPNTVAKAYQILQHNGLVEPVRGKGLRLVAQKRSEMTRRRQEILSQKIDLLIDEAQALGFSNLELLTLTKEHLKRR